MDQNNPNSATPSTDPLSQNPLGSPEPNPAPSASSAGTPPLWTSTPATSTGLDSSLSQATPLTQDTPSSFESSQPISQTPLMNQPADNLSANPLSTPAPTTNPTSSFVADPNSLSSQAPSPFATPPTPGQDSNPFSADSSPQPNTAVNNPSAGGGNSSMLNPAFPAPTDPNDLSAMPESNPVSPAPPDLSFNAGVNQDSNQFASQSPAPTNPFMPQPSPLNPPEPAPTDLSHLIDNTNTSAPVQTNPNTAPQSALPDAMAVTQPAPQPTQAVTSNAAKGFPKWAFAVGAVLLLVVVGVSAYFILGIGKQAELPASVPAEEQSETETESFVPMIPLATTEDTVEASGSSLESLTGGSLAPSPSLTQPAGASPSAGGTSAMELLRQRQGI